MLARGSTETGGGTLPGALQNILRAAGMSLGGASGVGRGTTGSVGAGGSGITKADVTAAWEKYNESGNPADMIRADALMKQWQAQGGDRTPQREAAKRVSTKRGRSGGRTSGMPLPPERPFAPLPPERPGYLNEERISLGQSKFNRWMDWLTGNKLKYEYGTGEDPTGYEKTDLDRLKKLDNAEAKIIGSTAVVRAQGHGGFQPVFKREDLALEEQRAGINQVPVDLKYEQQRLATLPTYGSPIPIKYGQKTIDTENYTVRSAMDPELDFDRGAFIGRTPPSVTAGMFDPRPTAQRPMIPNSNQRSTMMPENVIDDPSSGKFDAPIGNYAYGNVKSASSFPSTPDITSTIAGVSSVKSPNKGDHSLADIYDE
jgi:hypothetical protein